MQMKLFKTWIRSDNELNIEKGIPLTVVAQEKHFDIFTKHLFLKNTLLYV